MRFRQPGQGFCGLRLRVFPAWAPAAGRLGPKTAAPWASGGQPPLHAMTTPPEEGCGPPRVAPTICQGPLRLQGPACRSRHGGGCQAPSGALRRTKRLRGGQRRVVPAPKMPPCKRARCLEPKASCARFLYHRNLFPGNRLSATCGTGSWLDLTRWGLSPHKKRQASLGVRTPAQCGFGKASQTRPHGPRLAPRQATCGPVPGRRAVGEGR